MTLVPHSELSPISAPILASKVAVVALSALSCASRRGLCWLGSR